MRVPVFVVVGFLPMLSIAEDEQHLHHEDEMHATSSSRPLIKIAINPEARLSAARAGPMPAPVPCGTTAELLIKVVNQAFVTSHLDVKLVDAPPGGVFIFDPGPLKGVPEEFRKVHVTLTRSELTDLTLAFRLRSGIPDHGGSDQVHILMQCITESST